MNTAWDWITPSSRTFSYRASRITYGYASSRRRWAKRRSSSSSPWLIRLTVRAENVCPHSSSVIALTLRVDTLWTYISRTELVECPIIEAKHPDEST